MPAVISLDGVLEICVVSFVHDSFVDKYTATFGRVFGSGDSNHSSLIQGGCYFFQIQGIGVGDGEFPVYVSVRGSHDVSFLFEVLLV